MTSLLLTKNNTTNITNKRKENNTTNITITNTTNNTTNTNTTNTKTIITHTKTKYKELRKQEMKHSPVLLCTN